MTETTLIRITQNTPEDMELGSFVQCVCKFGTWVYPRT